MSLLHGRGSRWLALVLAVAWVSAVASADTLLTPSMHCHHMPCCPRSDGGSQECSTAQCAEQVPEKAEAQSSAERQERAGQVAASAVPVGSAARPAVAAARELMPGLRFTAAVFRLKDDLRI